MTQAPAAAAALAALSLLAACADMPAAPAAATTSAAAAASAYDRPPQPVLDVLHAPAPPQPVPSPTADTLMLVTWVHYPPIAQVAEPFLRLAGVRIEPNTRRRHDRRNGYGIAQCARAVSLVDVATARETRVELPAGGCADEFKWSADGKRFAFMNTSRAGVELWAGETNTGAVRRLGDAWLNPMLEQAFQWMPDQKTLLVKRVPANAVPPPAAGAAAIGPSIQESDGRAGESSTYEARDTLANRRDEDLFEFYGTSELALVDATRGTFTSLGKPAVFTAVEPAPDGKHILVTTIRRPYSYLVTYARFGDDVAVWDTSGRVVHTLAQRPLADRVPVWGVPTGPREFSWRPTEPATLVWAEALDGGDWAVKVPARDKVLMQAAPFTRPPVEIARTEQRFDGFDWGESRNVALLHEEDINRRWLRTFVLDVDDPRAKPRLLWDRSMDDRYNDPGRPVARVLPSGHWVMRQERGAIFLRAAGASPAGDRPFLDRMDLATGTTERLFRSDAAALEYFVVFTSADNRQFLTWHQSRNDPPNAKLRTIGSALPGAAAGEAAFAATTRALTHLPDPTPVVRTIQKRLVKYKRRDGVDLSFTLYTPPGYVEGTRLPAILYAYPLDYASTATAGQVSGSEQRFTRLDDYRLLLLSGYAVIDYASFPVVGEPTKAYDTYLEQLADNAQAAVDKAVESGVVDRDRIGVAGHSHGALMVVNLLAHTDLFRAGVAMSGSYNKTLTPFGFQNERRSVWKAPEVYIKASPFFAADKIKRPLLIVHGADDANPGTTPLQSTKLYEAVRGNGGTVRLVMLPHEPHWYSAMESNEQLAYEQLRWFDRYVKNAPPRR